MPSENCSKQHNFGRGRDANPNVSRSKRYTETSSAILRLFSVNHSLSITSVTKWPRLLKPLKFRFQKFLLGRNWKKERKVEWKRMELWSPTYRFGCAYMAIGRLGSCLGWQIIKGRRISKKIYEYSSSANFLFQIRWTF